MARLFWISFAVAMLVFAVMQVWTVPALTREAQGQLMLDSRFTGYGFDEVRAYLQALTPAGRALYLGPQHRLDLAYPVLQLISFVSGFFWLYRGLLRLALIALAMIGAYADLSENAKVAELLTDPDRVTPELVSVASFFTTLKTGAVSLCLLALAFAALRFFWRRWRG